MALPIRQLLDSLDSAENIALFSHSMPDADAIGSCLALKHFLLANYPGKNIDIFVDYDDATLSPLLKPLLENQNINTQNHKNYDLTIALDCTDENRFEKYKPIFNTGKLTINIDHHATNTNFAQANMVYPNASSTCELVYSIALITKKNIPMETAKFAYMGIITDTVCLTQNNVSKRTYTVLAELTKFNLEWEGIKNYFFKNNTKAKTFLLEKALRSLKFYDNEKVAVMKIKNNDLTELQATNEDTLGIVEHANNIEGVKIAAIFIETQPQHFYVSLRSKSELPVGDIAQQFGGGGHAEMAAFQFDGEVKDILPKLLDVCHEQIEKLPPEADTAPSMGF